MSEIQRYDYREFSQRGIAGVTRGHNHSAMVPDDSGQYIKHVDHLAKVATLEAENGRLKAPITEEEWDRNAVYGCNLVRGIDRISFRAILAARAQQPNPAQDKEQG